MHRTKFERAHAHLSRGETRFKCAHSLCAERARQVLCESKEKSAREQGESRVSREIRARTLY